MSEKLNYLECWTSVAASLFSQAVAGEPEFTESLPKPMAGSFGFAATVAGEEAGRFAVMLDAGLLEVPLLGEGADQKAAWGELLKEVADAAVGELLARTGRKCQIASFAEIAAESKLTRAFQLKAGDRSWSIQVRDEVRLAKSAEATTMRQAKTEKATGSTAAEATTRRVRTEAASDSASNTASSSSSAANAAPFDGWPGAAQSAPSPGLSPGLELLLDVELEASLRFGAREMPLGEILDLGPGDVVQLDRHITDPVDLIVGDKIVARGEVVLVNGNFGLRVTEVAEPQRRLESIRCLF
jgi:flagellar motor switch protein FliN